jgi:hypothetical protein
MGFSQEDESEKPEAAWENPVLVIVRGIKYNESYKMLTGGICMGSYLNPGNEAFAVALNSEIYVDKTGLLTYTNKVMNTLQGYICNSRPRRFGKSITANMLTAYYSKGCSSKEMFSGLEISRAKDFEKHLNQYDVLHWDIQWCMEPAGGPDCFLYLRKNDFGVKRILSPYPSRRNPVTAGGAVADQRGIRDKIYCDYRRMGCSDS